MLFMYGVTASSSEGWPTLLFGGALGIAAGAVASFLLYLGLIAIPVHRLFSVTSFMIALVAAGMAGQAAANPRRYRSYSELGFRAVGHVLAAAAEQSCGPRVARAGRLFRPSGGRAAPRLSGGAGNRSAVGRTQIGQAGGSSPRALKSNRVRETGHDQAAREYFIGGPVHKNDMEIVANYLVGIEMAPMMPNMVHGPKGPGAEIAVSLAEIPLEGMRRRGLVAGPHLYDDREEIGGDSCPLQRSTDTLGSPRESQRIIP